MIIEVLMDNLNRQFGCRRWTKNSSTYRFLNKEIKRKHRSMYWWNQNVYRIIDGR